MAIIDMYEIVHDMTQLGQNMLIVTHAERALPGEVAQSVADSYANSILPIVRLQQDNTVVNNELRVFNLGVPTDFHTQSLLGALGLRAGLTAPTFIGGAVRFPSLNREIRSGHKRFSGMQESDYTDGVLTAPANTLLENNGDALIGNWLSSIDAHVVANYAIIKRICKTTDPVTGKCLVYRLPVDDAELKFYLPNARIVNQNISSQVSRKVF